MKMNYVLAYPLVRKYDLHPEIVTDYARQVELLSAGVPVSLMKRDGKHWYIGRRTEVPDHLLVQMGLKMEDERCHVWLEVIYETDDDATVYMSASFDIIPERSSWEDAGLNMGTSRMPFDKRHSFGPCIALVREALHCMFFEAPVTKEFRCYLSDENNLEELWHRFALSCKECLLGNWHRFGASNHAIIAAYPILDQAILDAGGSRQG